MTQPNATTLDRPRQTVLPKFAPITFSEAAYRWFRAANFGPNTAGIYARAERHAETNDWYCEWLPDFDADLSWMDARELAEPHICEGCVLYSADGQQLTSLWGIVDATTEYRRIIAAELASEACNALEG